MITAFKGQHDWLSNFHPVRIVHNGREFPTAENAFQAAKCANEDDIAYFQTCTAAGAKQRGKRVKLVPDWNNRRIEVMQEVLTFKFSDANPELKAKLLATGEEELVEGNTWGDRFWGVCKGTGQNRLGIILMQIRKELAT